MNKQIEEMVRVMNECCNRYDEQGRHIGNRCYECEEWSDENHCCCSYNTKEATALYNAGFRKQRAGKWGFKGTAYGCSLCGFGVIAPLYDYCPNCGAKMKEGAECLS